MTPEQPPKESIKETIISVVIAFALAFVFRAFVAEAYVIPTGSMAPTLNGAHVRMHSPVTGADWAVGPMNGSYINNDPQNPMPEQGTWLRRMTERQAVPAEGEITHDPITGDRVTDPVGLLRSGDRIFVHKYLYALAEPEPWDVIVFKDPTNPDQNFIKRLIGLPDEEIALVDGDVFVRKLPRPADAREPWEQDGWSIRRKAQRVQQAVWQRVYDSSFVPPSKREGSRFVSPWVGSDKAIAEREGGRWFTFDGSAPVTLVWDDGRSFVAEPAARLFNTGASTIDGSRALNDRYGYNEEPGEVQRRLRFPVGDLRVRFGLAVSGDATKLRLAPTVTARGHEMRALVEGGVVRLQMRVVAGGAGLAEPVWTDLLAVPAPMPPIGGGAPVDVEFWHVDQTLALYVGGKRLAYAAYDWSPAVRLKNATRDDIFERLTKDAAGNPLKDARLYKRSGARIEIAGAAAELRRVGIDRDLYYTPAEYRADSLNRTVAGRAALATSPYSPLALGPDQFFACGDNSPNSSDGRLWTSVDEWVATQIDPTLGVVDRRMLLGKAFFVYWPATGSVSKIPVPDVGRMRFIQ